MHASNVKIAADLCDETISAFEVLEEQPGASDWLSREKMKKNCLNEAAEYMITLASFLQDRRVEGLEPPSEITE